MVKKLIVYHKDTKEIVPFFLSELGEIVLETPDYYLGTELDNYIVSMVDEKNIIGKYVILNLEENNGKEKS